jgi:hypothetical protein
VSSACDQIVPPDDPIEDEDKLIRERLRQPVIMFLAEEAREPLLSRLQSQRGDGGVEQELALVDTLLKVNHGRAFTNRSLPKIMLGGTALTKGTMVGGIQMKHGRGEDCEGRPRLPPYLQ